MQTDVARYTRAKMTADSLSLTSVDLCAGGLTLGLRRAGFTSLAINDNWTPAFGGKAKNMHARQRACRIAGPGGVDKTTMVAARYRRSDGIVAKVIAKATLQGFVAEHVAEEAMVYTDDQRGYESILMS